MKILFLVTFYLIVLASDALSEMYKYIDKNGTISFTDDISKIPKKSSGSGEPEKEQVKNGTKTEIEKNIANFPEETRIKKGKQDEQNLAYEQEAEIKNIFSTGYSLFEEKKYGKALPYLQDAMEKYEKHYVKYPMYFKNSLNEFSSIIGYIAEYYRWIAKEPHKAIDSYTKLIDAIDKYGKDLPIVESSAWFTIGEIYEKDIKDYQKALDSYKKYTDLIVSVKEKNDKGFVTIRWFYDWILYLQEKIKVVNLKKQSSFTQRKVRYPNIEYTYFFRFGGGAAINTSVIIDEEFMNFSRDYYSAEEFEKLYLKYPNSYQVMFIGMMMFYELLEDNNINDAQLISDSLSKYYPYDPNFVMLQFKLADSYKKSNDIQNHKEVEQKALKIAKSMNFEIILNGVDAKFASPEKTWELFVSSLKRKDIDSAIECFTPMSQPKYMEAFMVLKDKLDEVASFGTLRFKKKEETRAEYELLKKEEGSIFSNDVYFVDMYGEWKIERF